MIGGSFSISSSKSQYILCEELKIEIENDTISFPNDNYVVTVGETTRLMLFLDIIWSNEWMKKQFYMRVLIKIQYSIKWSNTFFNRS